MKVNPLHTPEWTARYMEDRGEYPGLRMTGRSTALALQLLASAIQNPHRTVYMQDHEGGIRGAQGDKHVRDLALSMAGKLGLEHLYPQDRNGLIFQRKN